MQRRHFIGLAATGSLAALQAAERPPSAPAAQPAPPGEVTRTLARFLVATTADQVPPAVRKEATRTLLNWIGVAVGGSPHETVGLALAAIAPFSGPPQAGIAGRRERLDIVSATLVNGISSHVLDFDDTHLKTIIHASSSIVPPLLALAEYRTVSGRDFLHALVLGVETALRVGKAIYPDHYDAGWHITGTAGAIGAAAGAGKLLDLSETQMVWALGLAASQSVGLRESFGSMNKSFNPGRAGQNGLMAALLAEKNFTSSEQMLEAKRGWAHTVSTKQDFREITAGLGSRYETALNTYKPFACGIVIHPVIDACLRLRAAHGLTAEKISDIALRVHPLVLELTGKKTPQDGLQSKFSVYHAAAVAIVEGRAGPRQFSDRAARDPGIVALRGRVTASADPAIKESQTEAVITLADGRTLRQFIEHAVGSTENPLSDQALEAKVADLMQEILPAAQARELIAAAWNVVALPHAATLARLAVPA